MKKIILVLMFFITNVLVSQTMDWTALQQPINKPVQSLVLYSNQLIAGGSFTMAGSNPAKRIASWNGSSWSNLGTGIRAGQSAFVGELLVYNNELYAAGRFDSAGSVATKNIAKWNGSTWSGFGTGSNDVIYAMTFFNGELYAGGTFTTISGVPAKNIAKWNGSSWQPLGAGVKSGYAITDLCVFQNELYAVGNFDTIGNLACQNIARWNGINWSNVSTGLPPGFNGLHVWQNKLLIGANNSTVSPNPTQIWQWDGSNLSLYSQQSYAGGSSFLTSNSKLYTASANPNAVGKSTIWEWNTLNSKWDSVGTKVQNVAALCEYNNEIYCAGFFTTLNGAQADYIAKLVTTTGLQDNSLSGNIRVYPNPVQNLLTITAENNDLQDFKFTLVNSLGQPILCDSKARSNVVELDVEKLVPGIYLLKIHSANELEVIKFIKQ